LTIAAVRLPFIATMHRDVLTTAATSDFTVYSDRSVATAARYVEGVPSHVEVDWHGNALEQVVDKRGSWGAQRAIGI
jgi:hypothetical protein